MWTDLMDNSQQQSSTPCCVNGDVVAVESFPPDGVLHLVVQLLSRSQPAAVYCIDKLQQVRLNNRHRVAFSAALLVHACHRLLWSGLNNGSVVAFWKACVTSRSSPLIASYLPAPLPALSARTHSPLARPNQLRHPAGPLRCNVVEKRERTALSRAEGLQCEPLVDGSDHHAHVLLPSACVRCNQEVVLSLSGDKQARVGHTCEQGLYMHVQP